MSRQLKSTPPQVSVALALIAADLALGIGKGFFSMTSVIRTAPKGSAIPVVVFTVMLSVYVLWIYGLYCRLNWLRWLTVALAVLGLVFLPKALSSTHNWRLLSLQMLQYLMFDSAAILLCLPAAGRWYGRKAAA